MNQAQIVYSIIQLIHTIDGALILGAPLFLIWYEPTLEKINDVLRFLFLIWGVQGITGISFGLASLTFYDGLPELSPVGLIAVLVKISCVIIAFTICGWFLYQNRKWGKINKGSWYILFALALISHIGAAILRWNT